MSETLSPELGTIVISKAGRDKMRSFIVVEIVDEHFVKIADGDLRKICNPKLKKTKHLNISKTVVSEIKEMLVDGLKVTDVQLKKAIADFTFGNRDSA